MSQLGFKKAVHLASRTGIGAEWDTVKKFERLTLDQAIDHLLNHKDFHLPSKPRMSSWSRTVGLRGNDRRMKMMKGAAKVEGEALQKWWVQHLLATRSPFLERMTLFWHNHFPSTIEKTLQPVFLYEQNKTLRKHALGNYRDLLFAISKDPAMLLYLDGYENVKQNPNENFARELLELFTINRGRYSELDIKAAARAFSGWSISDKTGKFIFRKDLHDSSSKTFLGQRGNFNGDDILNRVLKHRRTSEVIAEKLWHEFISISRPDPQAVKQWAEKFRASNYDIPTLLRAVLKSPQFWSNTYRGALIKSPVELAVGTLRVLPFKLSRNNLTHNLNIMGQGVFAQPSVKGWPGGKSWVSTQSMMRRASILTNLTRGNLNAAVNWGGLASKFPDASTEELIEWLLSVKPVHPLPTKPGKLRLVRALVLDPAYQVN